MRRVNLDLLSSALNIVVSDMIIKPKIEVKDDDVKIIYDFPNVTVTRIATLFEIESCVRLDFFVDKTRLDVKHRAYNSLLNGYKNDGL